MVLSILKHLLFAHRQSGLTCFNKKRGVVKSFEFISEALMYWSNAF
jgi:hypothetical protein